MRIFLTGGTGFVGSHMADYLLANTDAVIYAIRRWRSCDDNIKHFYDNRRVIFIEADLTDRGSLYKAIRRAKPDLVYHFAAQSFPESSFLTPVMTLTTNVIGTTNLMEELKHAREEGISDPIIISVSCYDEKTEVLTNRGFLKYNEINKNDLVVSINPINSTVEYTTIKSIIIDNFNGNMCKINEPGIDLLITPNHNIIYNDIYKSQKNYRFDEVKNLQGRNYKIYFPKGNFKGKDEKTIVIGKTVYNTTDIFYLTGLYLGDGYSDFLAKTVENKSGYKRKDFLKKCRDSNGKFCVEKKGKTSQTICHSYRVFLAIPENDKARKSAIECLKRMNIKYHLYSNEIFFSSRDLVEYFDQFTHLAHTKFIPEWMFKYDHKYLEFLYLGLMDSDGSYKSIDKTHGLYTTVSEKLANDFIKLGIFTGKYLNVSIQNEQISYIKKRKVKCSRHFRISVSSKKRMVNCNKIFTEYYNGKIWCLKLDSNHNFIIKRNGKINFCGNSSEVYGNSKSDEIPIKETNPIRAANPYSISKVGHDLMSQYYYFAYGLKIIITRMFSHEGSRRGKQFALSSFAHQIVAHEKSNGFPSPNGIYEVEHGNLNSVRTYNHIDDAVEAYWLCSTAKKFGEIYNIGGDYTCTVGDALDMLISKSKNPQSFVKKLNPDRVRPTDITLQIPDSSKFRKEFNWKPKKDLNHICDDLLNYWRSIVKHQVFCRKL